MPSLDPDPFLAEGVGALPSETGTAAAYEESAASTACAGSSGSSGSATSTTPTTTSTTTSPPLLPGLTLPKKKRPAASTHDDTDADSDRARKRQRNSLAARRYRQKKIDRIAELEATVAALRGECDGLRLQLARQEAETAALRTVLGRGN